MAGKRPAQLPAHGPVHAPLRYQRAEQLRKALGLDPGAITAHLGISVKTYARRRERGYLEDAESLKVEMLAVALAEAARVLGDADEARLWLVAPILRRGGHRPLAHLHTVQGYERIKETLVKTEYGMY